MQERTIRDVKHTLVVLRVDASDEQGRPRTLTLIGDAERVPVQDGTEFVTAWIPSVNLQKGN